MRAIVEGRLYDARRMLHDDFVVHETGGGLDRCPLLVVLVLTDQPHRTGLACSGHVRSDRHRAIFRPAKGSAQNPAWLR
jgi:hypothetical protein